MILDKIVAAKRKKVEQDKAEISLDLLIAGLGDCPSPRDFKKSLRRGKKPGIIAEIKKASPSKGIIKPDFNVEEIALCYEQSGVQAISVLTEETYFLGDSRYLASVRELVTVPVLRKDFIIDPYQIVQSRILGADLILLIAAMLSEKELISFQQIAEEIGLQCLVEVHDREELEVVLATQAEIIGINNRNLKTFGTSLSTTESLRPLIPQGKVVISESGINNRQDIEYLQAIGVDGVLIGESLMRAESIEDKLKELRGE